MSDHYYCRVCSEYYDECKCGKKENILNVSLFDSKLQEKIKNKSDPKILEEINKGEKLKKLLQIYPDLEFQDYKSLISRSSGHKCNKFQFVPAMGSIFLRIYFIENDYEIYVRPSFEIDEFKTNKELINHLQELNISEKLILEIIKNIPHDV